MIKLLPWKTTRGVFSYDVSWGSVYIEGWEPYIIWLVLYAQRQHFTIISTPTGQLSCWKWHNDLLERTRNEMMIPSTMLGFDQNKDRLAG